MKQKRIEPSKKRKIAIDYLDSDLTQIQIAVKYGITLLTLQRILRDYKNNKLKDS